MREAFDANFTLYFPSILLMRHGYNTSCFGFKTISTYLHVQFELCMDVNSLGRPDLKHLLPFRHFVLTLPQSLLVIFSCLQPSHSDVLSQS
jgi:hypothetical protein